MKANRICRKWMLRNSVLLATGLLLSGGVYAQQQGETRLTGKVMQEGRPVPDVHIMNVSRELATISDEAGAFTILARTGDTLYFSAVQLKRKTLTVTEAMLMSLEILVPLEEFVNELDEVVVRPYNLSGDISRDIARMPAEQVYVAATLGLPNAYAKPLTQAERMLFEATSGSGLVPLNPILNAISGRTGRLKKILAAERRENRTQRIRNYYPDSLFTGELRIPSDKIDDFMYFCEADSLFNPLAESQDRLRIWEFLIEKGEEYHRNNKAE